MRIRENYLDQDKVSEQEDRASKCLAIHFEDMIWGRLGFFIPYLNDLHLSVLEEIILDLNTILHNATGYLGSFEAAMDQFFSVVNPVSKDKLLQDLIKWMSFIEFLNYNVKKVETKLKVGEYDANYLISGANYGTEPTSIDEVLNSLLASGIDKEIQEVDELLDWDKIKK